MHLKYFSFGVFLIFVCVSVIHGRKFVLDWDNDQTKEFLDIDCYYTQNYEDFWSWGCDSSNPPPATSATSTGGYWSSCQKECRILYYGKILPAPKSILIEGFVSGKSKIEISGAFGPSITNQSIWDPIQTIPASAEWISVLIDVSGLIDIYIFEIKAVGSAEGYVLIDKITIDLGDDVPDPPTTTTPAPPVNDGIITLDVLNDNSKYWRESCYYSHHYNDFDSAWGCPTNDAIDGAGEPNPGYWTPCGQESCQMLYYGTVLEVPVSLQLSVHIQGAGQILIFGKQSPFYNETLDQPLFTVSVPDGKWYCNNVGVLDLTRFTNVYAVSFKLLSPKQVNSGYVLVDKISAHLLQSAHDGSTSSIVGSAACKVENHFVIEPTTDAPTNAPTNAPTYAPSTVKPGDGNAGPNISGNLLAIIFLFAAPIIKYLIY